MSELVASVLGHQFTWKIGLAIGLSILAGVVIVALIFKPKFRRDILGSKGEASLFGMISVQGAGLLVLLALLIGGSIYLLASGETPHTHGADPKENPPSASIAVWKSNWALINEGMMMASSSQGWTRTNRAQLLRKLNHIEPQSNTDLNSKLQRLEELVRNAPATPDPNYNIEYTAEMKGLYDELRTGIRKHLLSLGIDPPRNR